MQKDTVVSQLAGHHRCALFAKPDCCLPNFFGIVGRMDTPRDWERLARFARQARGSRTQKAVDKAGGPSHTTLSKIEHGRWRPTRGVDDTIAKLENVYQWAPGSVDITLAGGNPVLLSDELGAIAESLGAALHEFHGGASARVSVAAATEQLLGITSRLVAQGIGAHPDGEATLDALRESLAALAQLKRTLDELDEVRRERQELIGERERLIEETRLVRLEIESLKSANADTIQAIADAKSPHDSQARTVADLEAVIDDTSATLGDPEVDDADHAGKQLP